MTSSLPKILNSDFSQLKDHNIEKEYQYGQVIVEELPENKIIIIKKDKIEIIEKDKYLRVDENFDIEVKGDIIINKQKGNNLDGFVSENKLKLYLFSILGNFGAPIFSDVKLQNLSFDTIKVGEDS